jgi:small GTP-binding protein
LIGKIEVGKTSLLKKLIDEDFDIGNIKPTVGVDSCTIEIDGMNFRICDTSGEERYLALNNYHLRNCFAVLYCLRQDDVAEGYQPFLELLDKSDVQERILVFTKSDLFEFDSQIPFVELKEKFGCQEHIVTSAKTGYGIENLKTLLSECGKRYFQAQKSEAEKPRMIINDDNLSGKKSCC